MYYRATFIYIFSVFLKLEPNWTYYVLSKSVICDYKIIKLLDILNQASYIIKTLPKHFNNIQYKRQIAPRTIQV